MKTIMKDKIAKLVTQMPNLMVSYVTEHEIGIVCKYAVLRADKMEELKSQLGLKDLYVSYCPAKMFNIGGIYLIGEF